MKAKVKLDSTQLKAFFLHHVEKLVFGGFVAAFLLICWSAFKLKPYEKTPDQLKKLADDIAQQVEAKQPSEIELPSVPNFSNLGAVGPAPVDPRFYVVKPLNLPYEERQERRKQPKFYGLEEPLVYCGYGGIAIGESGLVTRVAGFGSGAMDSGSPMMMDPMMGMGPGHDPQQQMQMQQQHQMQQQQQTQQMQQMQQPGMMPGGMQGGRGRTRTTRDRSKKPVVKRTAPKPVARPKPQSVEKIAITQPPANSQVEGRYWVCLVGAVPYWKQLNEYQVTFRDASLYDVKRDFPRYALPLIERAEVTGGNVGEWEELNVESAVEDLDKWAAEYPEIVDPRFIDPETTEPLPPLVYANHDKEKISHPRTKVAEQKPTAVDDTKKRAKLRSLGGGARGRNSQAGNPQGMMPTYGSDPYGGGYGMGMAGSGAGPLVEHKLFRFFDFDVKPGKTYCYRVKLVLRNPNAGVPPRFLESYEFAKGPTRNADWSQPSPPVTVIAGNRLLAGGVTHGRTEPTAKVLAKLFDAKLAAEIRRVFDIGRGSILNEIDAKVGLPDGATLSGRAAELDFETNAVVLDMFGGEKLPGTKSKGPSDQPKIPGHILVLDNDGELKTLVQSNDAGMYETEAEEAEQQRNVPAEARNERAGPQGGGNDGGFLNFDNLGDPKKKPKK